MKRDEIEFAFLEELRNLAPEFCLDELRAIAGDSDLREALDIDSISLLNLVGALHRRLGVDVPELDYPRLVTKAGAVAYLAARLSQDGGRSDRGN